VGLRRIAMHVTRQSLFAAALSGLLLAFAFPSADWNWLAWVALVPLLVVLQEVPLRGAFVLGWITGVTFYLGTLYWIVYVIGTFTPIPYAVALIPLLVLSGVLAVYHGAFAAAVVFAGRRGIEPLVFAPLCWVALEWLRSWLGIGFPWGSLGYSQYRSHNLVQIAEITGVYGLSALVVLFNVVIAAIVSRRGTTAARAAQLGVLTIVFAAVQQFGVWRLNNLAGRDPDHTLRAAVIQGNIAQEHKWDPAYQDATIAAYERLSREAARGGATLIVWPESAAPFYFDQGGPLAERIRQVARDNHAWLLFGSPARENDGDGRLRLRNRAHVIAPNGDPSGFYDKVQLVPFGEYVPLQSLLFFVDKLVEGAAPFVSGDEPRALRIGPIHAGVLICYESIFPALARALVSDGAELLVNITNDAWFGPTSAPYQHLAMASLRAVENRVPVLRAANTGISAVIQPDGSMHQETELFEAAYRATELSWPAVDTVYRRFGDVFAGACLLCSIAWLLVAQRRAQATAGRREQSQADRDTEE
jgi:apolipoprotein N-acyltransferase